MSSNLRKKSIVALVCLLVLLALYQLLVFFGVPKEDSHLLCFPVLLAFLYLLPLPLAWKVPRKLLFSCVVLWGFAYVGVESYSFHLQTEPHTFFTRLKGDSTGLSARGFKIRYNEIASTYHLPQVRIIRKTFNDDLEAVNWIKKRSSAVFLISGLTDWLRVIFNPDIRQFFEGYPDTAAAKIFSKEKIPKVLNDRIAKAKVAPGKTSMGVYLPAYKQPFLIVFQPKQLAVPNQPSELSLHLLAWLARAMQKNTSENPISWEEQLSDRLFSSDEASRILGDWKSSSPLGLALHLKSSFMLLELLSQPTISRFQCRKVVDSFYDAASKARLAEAPQLYASVFNNAAVALLSCAESSAELDKATKWLQMALDSGKYEVSEGAKAAIFNLRSLDLVRD